MFRYTLKNGSKKDICPNCGRKTFVRVVDTETGGYLPNNVGRCDRESKCGYQYKWNEYLHDNAAVRQSDSRRAVSKRKGSLGHVTAVKAPSFPSPTPRFTIEKVDHLDVIHLLETIGHYDRNSFVQFLTQLFPYDTEAVFEAIIDYKIGTCQEWTSFPVIDRQGRFCKARLMKFDPRTGKRLKDSNGKGQISSLQAKLKQGGRLKQDFETDKRVFFGDHLTAKYPSRPIAIVESEKTAVIASICKGVFPDLVWLASGGKSNLNADKLTRLRTDRRVILFPDADGFEQWQITASEARGRGVNVVVSDLIKKHATREERARGADLADYLIRIQRMKNDLARDLEEMREERIAIMVYDGKLTEEEAEEYLG